MDSPTKKIVINREQFFRVCETLKKNKQQFLEQRPNAPKAAKMLGDLCGFPISKTVVPRAQEATGVRWVAKHTVRPRNSKGYALRTLTNAVVTLYRELGQEIPDSLRNLQREVNYRSGSAEQPSNNGEAPTEELPPQECEPGRTHSQIRPISGERYES